MKMAFFDAGGCATSVYEGDIIQEENPQRGIVLVDDLDPFAHWMTPEGELVPRQQVTLNVDKTRLIADGIDVANLTGLPGDADQPARITATDTDVIVVKLTGKYDSNVIAIQAEPYDVWLAELRAERSVRLTACDWTAMPDNDLTPDQRAAWASYRKKLRDLTVDQPRATLDSVEWPVSPD
jgi:hypothetical protein